MPGTTSDRAPLFSLQLLTAQVYSTVQHPYSYTFTPTVLLYSDGPLLLSLPWLSHYSHVRPDSGVVRIEGPHFSSTLIPGTAEDHAEGWAWECAGVQLQRSSTALRSPRLRAR